MTQLTAPSIAAVDQSAQKGHLRGDERLYPPRLSGRYYVLTMLRRELELIIREHLQDCREQTLVDYGCGDMPHRPLFEPYVGRYISVDLPSNPAADLTITSGGGVPLADAAAGVVWSSQVLEHVPDPAAYLAECGRLLAPGGRLILSTHGVWKYHPHPTDFWRWTSAGLRRTIEAQGFTITHFRGLLGMGAIGMMLMQDAIVPKLPRPMRRTAAGFMQQLVALMDRMHNDAERATDASSFILVAQRA